MIDQKDIETIRENINAIRAIAEGWDEDDGLDEFRAYLTDIGKIATRTLSCIESEARENVLFCEVGGTFPGLDDCCQEFEAANCSTCGYKQNDAAISTQLDERTRENDRLKKALKEATRDFLSANGIRSEWWLSVLDIFTKSRASLDGKDETND